MSLMSEVALLFISNPYLKMVHSNMTPKYKRHYASEINMSYHVWTIIGLTKSVEMSLLLNNN